MWVEADIGGFAVQIPLCLRNPPQTSPSLQITEPTARMRERTPRAIPVLRDKLIAAYPKMLLGLHNCAIIAVGYDTLCRRFELVGLSRQRAGNSFRRFGHGHEQSERAARKWSKSKIAIEGRRFFIPSFDYDGENRERTRRANSPTNRVGE